MGIVIWEVIVPESIVMFPKTQIYCEETKTTTKMRLPKQKKKKKDPIDTLTGTWWVMWSILCQSPSHFP